VKRRLKEGAKNIAWNLNKERKRSGQPETKDLLSPLERKRSVAVKAQYSLSLDLSYAESRRSLSGGFIRRTIHINLRTTKSN